MRIRPQPSAGTMNLGKNLTATGCFLLLLVLVSGHPWPTGIPTASFVLLAVSGVLGLALCDSILFRAFLEIGPRRTNVYMATWPVWVGILALLPPLAERPPLTVWVGMAITLSGVVLAILERPTDASLRARLSRGARYALVAAFLQAVGILLAREAHRIGEVTVAEASTLRLVFGSLGLIALGLTTRRLGRWTTELRRPGTWPRILLAGFIATFLGIWTNQAGVAWATHAGVAATLNSLAPIWLIPLSVAFLGEQHDRRAWISAGLAVAGIALMTLR
jgi:drug/metabolite transporter (DMT)-like permease